MDIIMIYALCGRVGSGKTTIAKYLVDNYQFIRIRFAEPLKKMLRDGLEIDDEYIDGDKKNEPCDELCGRTVRHAMMTLGTEWGRMHIDKDIWVNLLGKKLVSYVNNGKTKFVIDDMRFLSEEKWLDKMVREPYKLASRFGDSIVIVQKILIDRIETVVIDHQSEQEFHKIKTDWTVYNNNGLDSLYRSIDDIVSRIIIN